MTETYGHRWTSHMGDQPNRTWKTRLSGLTMEQIQRGLDKDFQRGDDWPPSAPKFVELCLGSYADFDMLEPEAAYQAAGKRMYQAPGVYHTLVACGGPYEFQRMTADRAKPLFMKEYRRTLERCREGWPIRVMPQAAPDAAKLEDHRDREPTPEEFERGRKALAEIRAKLGMGPSPQEEQASEQREP